MIQINDCEIKYKWSGLFMTDEEWIHPKICEDTFEIIYVTSGDVYIKEDGKEYHLTRGNLIVLKPGEHEGCKKSYGKTAFYWFHFYCNSYSALPIKSNVFSSFEKNYLFKELLHHHCAHDFMMCEITLLYILSGLFSASHYSTSPLAANVLAWVNANADATLTAKRVGKHFGYNSEHISRLVKKTYSCTLKELITRETISAANNYLANSDYSVKEIAALLRFSSANAFVHFYKYHEGKTPAQYRNTYPLIKINKR